MTEKKLPKRVLVVKSNRIAPDHINTRLYEQGEVHAVGSDSMPEDMARSLLDDGLLESAGDDDAITNPPEVYDHTLDVASGRHLVSEPPLEKKILSAFHHHADTSHSVEEGERVREAGVYPPRQTAFPPPAVPVHQPLTAEDLRRTAEQNANNTLGSPVVAHIPREQALPDQDAYEKLQEEQAHREVEERNKLVEGEQRESKRRERSAKPEGE